MKVTGNGIEYLEDREEASTASLILVIVLLIGSALAFTLLTGPFGALLGEHRGAIPAAFHGTMAFLYLFVGTIGLYLAWRLWTGRIRAFADLQLLATVSATFSFLAIVFGNWLYIYYRVKDSASPRSYFLATSPVIHKIFFEFKEFAALFTLPLTVVAAFVLWYYGVQVLDRKWLRYSIAIVLALSFFYLVVAFGLGAAVTKLKPA
jgi:hypothetical protein